MTTNQLFFNESTINFDNLVKTTIIIFSEKNGRKTNTYIVDWEIEKEDMKNHLKILKKKHGCNGSIKMKNYQGDEKQVLHLQGEWKSDVKEYLMSLDVKEENIEVKV
jgi:translation initiation factor 1 (eIF-1/SUI1)